MPSVDRVPVPQQPDGQATPSGVPFPPEVIQQREAALGTAQETHARQAEAETGALEKGIQAVENQPLPQRQIVPMPQRPQGPVVDPKQFQDFASGIMGLAMIAGLAGDRGRWLNTLTSLNGALGGYLEGKQDVAKEQFANFDRDFKAAQARQDQANQEFSDILNQRNQSINQMTRRLSTAAAKWGRIDVYDAAKERNIDRMHTANSQYIQAHERIGIQYDKLLESLVNSGLKIGEGGKIETATPDAGSIDNQVALARSGLPRSQVVAGIGKQAGAQWTRITTAAVDQIMKENPDMNRLDAAHEFAMEQVGLKATARSVGQLETMLGATRQSIKQLEFNIDKTKEVLQTIPSSDISPVINAIARGEEKWTGDPQYSTLFYYMHAVATESARILSGGQASIAQLNQGAADEAKQWANVNMTPKSFIEGVGPAMLEEGRYRIKTYEDAISEQEKGKKPTSYPREDLLSEARRRGMMK